MEVFYYSVLEWPVFLTVHHTNLRLKPRPSKSLGSSNLTSSISSKAWPTGGFVINATQLNRHKQNASEYFVLSARKEKARIEEGFAEQVTFELGAEK